MIDRRAFVSTSAALAAVLPGTASLAQSSGADAVPTKTPLAPVRVLYAGSLIDVMEHGVARGAATVGLRFLGEGKGSVALAREIESQTIPADVFVSADTKVLDGLASAPNAFLTWYVTFAATRLVLGYSKASPFAGLFGRIAAGKEPLASAFTASHVRIGRTDPALDPKGYRSILAMKLLELAGTVPAGFTDRVLGDPRNAAQVLPEETMLTRLETGDVDFAFLYETEAVERRFATIELPKEANLGDPALASTYARASVTIDGTTHVGSPATYALTILTGAPDADAAQQFVSWLFSAPGRAVLRGAGVDLVPPTIGGKREDVPAALRGALGLS